MKNNELHNDAIALLQDLVRTPSFSNQEAGTAYILDSWLADRGMKEIHRAGNNVWVKNLSFDTSKPTILLCSHHDTVKPNAGYTRDPFDAAIDNNRLYGLGSNDAGASVVSLVAAFRCFYERKDLKYNLILALVAEEEISGPRGIRSVLPEMGMTGAQAGKHDFAIVGEPTMQPSAVELARTAEARGGRQSQPTMQPSAVELARTAEAQQEQHTEMRLAIAEKGLLVLDCTAHGEAGHAARDEGVNAIYQAIKDIEWFRTYRFPRKSDLFGDVKMSVTMLSAGTQHNVVPAECRFTVDVRVTERYTNEEVLQIVREHVTSDVIPRSMHLRPSSISLGHPIVQAAKTLGFTTFGSPTTSDQVALDIPSVKIGPGQSYRSHSADEYVELSEIEQGIDLYIKLLDAIL